MKARQVVEGFLGGLLALGLCINIPPGAYFAQEQEGVLKPVLQLGSVSAAPGQSDIALPVVMSFERDNCSGWAVVVAFDPNVINVSGFESTHESEFVEFKEQADFSQKGSVGVVVVYTRGTDRTKMVAPGEAQVLGHFEACVLPNATPGVYDLSVQASSMLTNGVEAHSFVGLVTPESTFNNVEPVLVPGSINVKGQPISESLCTPYEPPPPPKVPNVKYQLKTPDASSPGSDFSAEFYLTSEVPVLMVAAAIGYDDSRLTCTGVQLSKNWLTQTSWQLLAVDGNKIGFLWVPDLQKNRSVFPAGVDNNIASLNFHAREGSVGTATISFVETVEADIKLDGPVDPNVAHVKFRNAVGLDQTNPPLDLENLDSTTVAVKDLAGANLALRAPGQFRRGDANLDGKVNLTDAVAVLRSLFLGDSRLECEDAGDADDSGFLNLTDPILILNFLFTGGAAPPDPGPFAEGEDPTPDSLSCAGG